MDDGNIGVSQNHGELRKLRKVCSIVYKTQNVQILLTNHELVTENGPTPQPRKSP